MDLNARIGVNFARVCCKFSNDHCNLILLYCFYFDNGQHQDPIYTPYKILAKYTSHFGKMDISTDIYLGST